MISLKYRVTSLNENNEEFVLFIFNRFKVKRIIVGHLDVRLIALHILL